MSDVQNWGEVLNPKTVGNLAKYLLPTLTFFLGLWWQSRTAEKSDKLAVKRDRENARRERDSILLMESMGEVVGIANAAIEVARTCRDLQNADLDASDPHRDEGVSVDWSRDRFEKARNNFAEAEANMDDVLARLLMLRMDACSKNLSEIEELIVKMNYDYHRDPIGYEFRNVSTRCVELKKEMIESLVARYEQLWNEMEDENSKGDNDG